MILLLDSDVVIDLARGFAAAIDWLQHIDLADELAVSGYTAMEVIQGCRNRSEQLRAERTLSRFRVLWLTPDDAQTALAIFTEYRLSHGATILDTLIGHTSVANNLPLLTFNVKHFVYLPGIQILQPYRRSIA